MRRTSGWSGSRSLYSVVLRQTFPLQVAVIALGLVLPPLAVLPLELQKRVIDEAIPAGDMELLAVLAVIYLGAVGVRTGAKYLVVWIRFWIAEIVARVLRVALVDAQRRRRGAPARRALGAATSIMAGEVEPLGGFAAEALNTPLIQGGTLLGVMGFMAVTEPSLAVIGAAALVVEGALTFLLQHWINILTFKRIRTLRRAGRDIIEASAEAPNGHLVASLHEIRLSYRLRMRMNRLKSMLKVGRNLVDYLAEIAVLIVGAAMVMAGETELGVVVAFLSGVRQLRDPWSELVSFYRRLADARVKYRLVYGVLKAEGPGAARPSRGAHLRAAREEP